MKLPQIFMTIIIVLFVFTGCTESIENDSELSSDINTIENTDKSYENNNVDTNTKTDNDYAETIIDNTTPLYNDIFLNAYKDIGKIFDIVVLQL